MTDRPIIFSAPMVRALLDGRKTQTRRVLKPWPGMQSGWLTMESLHRAPTCYLCEVNGHLGAQMQHPLAGTTQVYGDVDPMSPLGWVRLPYAPGDRLYVREHWRTASAYDDLAPSEMGGEEPVRYEADASWQTWGWGAPLRSHGRFRQGMHMPRWASRLTLTVTEIRVQRLQEISEADAMAEGCEAYRFPGPWWQGYRDMGDGDLLHQQVVGDEPPDWMIEPHRMRDHTHLNRSAVDIFAGLWNSLHGPDAWGANPWVVAMTFTVRQENIDA